MMNVLSVPAPWYVAGLLIGLLIVALLWIANKPFESGVKWRRLQEGANMAGL